MSHERRPDRRPGGRPGGGRQDRPPRERGGFGGERPARDRPFGADRAPRERGFGGDRPPRPGGFRPRDDEGGMSIRLDPRRLSALKLLAAEAGVRPGELVTSWVEERLDAARAGRPPADGVAPAQLVELATRLDELARRLERLEHGAGASSAEVPTQTAEDAEPAAPRRRGRPRKAVEDAARAAPTGSGGGPRVPLHEEIADVIRARGPLTAAEIATEIGRRGRYAPPRSSRPLDAATVNSRVSNPAYRDRFVRSEGRIGLASSGE